MCWAIGKIWENRAAYKFPPPPRGVLKLDRRLLPGTLRRTSGLAERLLEDNLEPSKSLQTQLELWNLEYLNFLVAWIYKRCFILLLSFSFLLLSILKTFSATKSTYYLVP